MRPAGEVRQALMDATLQLVPPEVMLDPQAPRPTLREIAYKACVGIDVATTTIKNMARSGRLRQVRTRRVDYCNKPVAEYEPVLMDQASDCRHGQGWVDLGRIVGGWAR